MRRACQVSSHQLYGSKICCCFLLQKWDLWFFSFGLVRSLVISFMGQKDVELLAKKGSLDILIWACQVSRHHCNHCQVPGHQPH